MCAHALSARAASILLLVIILLAPTATPAAHAQGNTPGTTIYLPVAVAATETSAPAPESDLTEPDIDTVPDTLWSTCQPDGVQSSGAIYRICMPPETRYNGSLIIWAHGYVDFTKPVEIPESHMCFGGVCISDIANALGFGFATTSYSVNGLAVRQGLADVIDLVDVYTQQIGEPEQVLLLGASEGGIITALATEGHPDLFAGGLAMCGPIGSFTRQINYFGDFRVAFDYFFPGVMPGDAITIPPELIANWDTFYAEEVEPVIFDPDNADALDQLLAVSNIAYDPADFEESVNRSVRDALWYNVFATDDATVKLGGQPFDNTARYYRGSEDDALLNASVPRYAADPAAVTELNSYYQTSGVLEVPLVTLHTTLDQQVPYWHEPVYRGKTFVANSSRLRTHIPVARYRHCNFQLYEALGAFGVLYYRINGAFLDMSVFDDDLSPAHRTALNELVREFVRQ